jgi:hypothetical protein
VTLCALWSGLTYPANSFTYSADRLTATCNYSSSRSNTFIGVGFSTGRYRFSYQIVAAGSTVYAGVADTSTSLTATGGDPAHALLYSSYAGQAYLLNSGYTPAFNLGTPSNGDWIDVAFDAGAGLVWMRRNGGPWNANSSADPDTNVGGYACPGITSFTPLWQSYGAGSTLTLNTGASAYAYVMPTTFNDLPATLAVDIAPFAGIGDQIGVPWTDADLSGGLNYSLNGGAWTACTGSVSGTSGLAYAGSISGASFNNIAIQDATNTLDQTPIQTVAAITMPSGAGTLVAQAGGIWTPSGGTPTLTLTGGPYSKIYLSVLYGDYSGEVGSGGISLYNSDGQQETNVDFSCGLGSGPITLGGGGPVGASPTSGPVDVTNSATSSSLFGTLDASFGLSGGSPTGTATITNDGTVTQYGTAEAPYAWAGTQTLAFDTVVLSPGALFGSVGVAFGVWGPQAPAAVYSQPSICCVC